MTNDNIWELKQLLECASHEDRTNLERLIKAPFGNNPDKLCDHFQFLLHGFFGQIVNKDDYRKFVTRVADHIQIDWPALNGNGEWRDLSASDIEDAILITALQRIGKNINDKDRCRMAEELGKLAREPDLFSELISNGVAVKARLNNFQRYLLATTVVGAMTAAIDITLPFPFYTEATGKISVSLKTVDWQTLVLPILLNLNEPKWHHLLLGIVYVAYIRNKIEHQAESGPDREIFKKLKNVICEQLGVNPEQIAFTSSFVEDLGRDNMDMLELRMAIEEEFGIVYGPSWGLLYDGYSHVTVGSVLADIKRLKPTLYSRAETIRESTKDALKGLERELLESRKKGDSHRVEQLEKDKSRLAQILNDLEKEEQACPNPSNDRNASSPHGRTTTISEKGRDEGERGDVFW